MDLTDNSTLVFSVGTLGTLAGYVSAWATMRTTIKHHADRIAELQADLKHFYDRLQSLERFKARIQGASHAAGRPPVGPPAHQYHPPSTGSGTRQR